MSIKRLAADLGISISTVSKALNGYSDVSAETIKRVNEAAQAIGYVPNPVARRLVTGKSKMIGIVLPVPRTDFVDPFFSTLLAGASHRLLADDYLLAATAIPTGDKEVDRYERLLQHGYYDGLILIRTRSRDARIDRLLKSSLPFVSYGRTERSNDFAWLDMDNEEAFYMAAKRLLELGHRNIAFLNANEKLYFACLRKKGALKAFSESQIGFDETKYSITEISEQAAKSATKEILQKDRSITAVLCATDTQAIGAMAACREADLRVGRDIAVIGCDNNPQGQYSDPPLTSIQHGNVLDIGRKLADMMLRLISGTPIPDLQDLMKPEWVERESCCVCPADG